MSDTYTNNEGYDPLDVNTSVAVEFVKRHKAEIDSTRVVAAVPRSPEVDRTLIVVDAACDVSKAWLEQNSIVVMPRTIVLSDQRVVDLPSQDASTALVQRMDHVSDNAARSQPFTPVAMRDLMQRRMQPGTEAVLHICVSARRSKHFVNALSATQSLVLIHNKVRRTLGQPSTVTAWVIDSLNALGGVGVMLAHAIDLRARGMLAANIA
ncbi:MAG: DegV family protein, partial [Casimicrobium sp.]